METIPDFELALVNILDKNDTYIKLVGRMQEKGITRESTELFKNFIRSVQLTTEILDKFKIEIKNNRIPVLGENLICFVNKIINLIENQENDDLLWHIQCEILPCYKIWKYLINYFYISCRDSDGISQYWEKESQHLNKLFKSPKFDTDIDYPYELSIIVLFYNSLEVTRECIESILKYTEDIDYELITVNNGSDEETTAWSESLPHTKKIHLKYNIGSSLGSVFAMYPGVADGRYCIYLSNDVVLTKDYAKNLLNCIKSDPKIGMAAPVCNSLVNRQSIPVNYNNMEEMQQFAAGFNRSDPRKWEERERLLPYAAIYRPEVIKKIGFIYDPIFIKCDVYADDDFSQKIKYAGYKLINCSDTFIHHSQLASHGGSDDVKQLEGRQAIFNKYGYDVCHMNEDLNIFANFVLFNNKKEIRLLVIDSYTGEEALAIKNYFKLYNIRTHITAFLTEDKMVRNLEAVADKVVTAPNINSISSLFADVSFNIILISRDPGDYLDIVHLMKDMYTLLEKEGVLLFSFFNPFSSSFIYYLLLMLPFSQSLDKNSCIRKSMVNYDVLLDTMKDIGYLLVHKYIFRDGYLDAFPSCKETLLYLAQPDIRKKLEENLSIKKYYLTFMKI